jgi:hypothetical protein
MKTGLTLAAAVLSLSFGTQSQRADIVGSWRGTSLCVDKAHFPACKDEHVIYDVTPKGNTGDTVTLRADKIVNGVREFMGEFDFARAADSAWVAHFENPRAKHEIVLRVRSDHMTGYMTDLLSGRRPREMALDRVPAK